MNDKYKILQENPKNCKRLFGIDFVTFKIILEKVQNNIDNYLQENPLSKRGLSADFTIANRSGEPSIVTYFGIFAPISNIPKFRVLFWNFRKLCK